jgi:hypothetical protein
MLAHSFSESDEGLFDLLSALVEFTEAVDLGLVVLGDLDV